MRRAIQIALVAAAVTPAPDVAADYTTAPRVAYIESALRQVSRSTPVERTAIARTVHLTARTKCRASFTTPAVACVLRAVADYCAAQPASQQQPCRLLSDVAMTNMLGENEFVDRRTRIRLMNVGSSYREAMWAALHRRHAELATLFILTARFAPGDNHGAAIDGYCRQFSRGHRLSWARCAAALVWYIGSGAGGGHP